MITLRQIERTWTTNKYQQQINDLLVARTEDSPRLRSLLTGSLAAAALGLIRLDELNQSHAPLAGKFLNRILASQAADGGWDDPILTALCLRALLTSRGAGDAINRCIKHLADLQKADGAWPATPIRRLDADGFTSAFILFSLGTADAFQSAIRLEDAINWFEQNLRLLEAPAARLWERTRPKLATAIKRREAQRARVEVQRMEFSFVQN